MRKRYIYATIFCTKVYINASVIPYLKQEMNDLYISLVMHEKGIKHDNTYNVDYVKQQIDDILTFTITPHEKINDPHALLKKLEELETKHTLILHRLEAIYGQKEEIKHYKESITELHDYAQKISAGKDNASKPAISKIETLIAEIKNFQDSTLDKYNLWDTRVEGSQNKDLTENFINQSYQNAVALYNKHETLYNKNLTVDKSKEFQDTLYSYKRAIDDLNSDISSVLIIKNKRFPSPTPPSFSSPALIGGVQLGDFYRAYEELEKKMADIKIKTSLKQEPDYSSLKDEMEKIVNTYINTFNEQLNIEEYTKVRALEGELAKFKKS